MNREITPISAKNTEFYTKKRWTELAGTAATVLTAFLLLLAQNDLMWEANVVTLVPLAGAAVALFFFPNGARNANRKTRLTAGILTAIFFLMLPITSMLGSPLVISTAQPALRAFFQFIYPPVTLYATFVVIHACICAALRKRPAEGPELVRLHPSGFYRAAVPLFAVALMCVLSALPSMLIGDAPTIWHFAENGIWDEWHTAGYLFFVRGLYEIVPSQTLVTLVQAVFYVLVSQQGLTILRECGVSPRGCRVYIAASILTFMPLYFLFMMIKDVMFSTSLLWFGFMTLRAVNRERLTKWDIALLGISGFLVSIFRLGGVLPVFATLVILFFSFLLNKRRVLPVILAAAIAASGFIGVKILFDTRPDNRQNPYYLTYSIPMQMIGDLVSQGLEMPAEDAAVLEEVMPVSRWGECFQHYHSDAISRYYGKIGDDVEKVSEKRLGPALVKVNLHLFLRYPAQYIKAFFDQNSLMWEISMPPDGYERPFLWFPSNESSVDAPENTYYTGFTGITSHYAEFLWENNILHPLIWRGGFYTFLTLFSAAVLLLKRRARDLIGLAPFFAVTVGMLFSLPAQESRYAIPNALFAVLFTVYALYIPSHESEETKE